MKVFILIILFTTSIFSNPSNDYKLAYMSYWGGTKFEQARDIAVDSEGNIYITGGTQSRDFPTSDGVYNKIFNDKGSSLIGTGGPMMIFISKFSSKGDLIWSTLLGGPNYDRAYGIEVDKNGFVYVGGRAGSEFPTTPGAFQESFTQKGGKNNLYGHQNGFIAKLSPDGKDLIWSTYYGADSYGFFRDIAVDDEGYVYGILNAVKTKPLGMKDDAFQSSPQGNYDMVAVKFNQTGTDVEWATFIGGSDDDSGGPSIKVGPDKSVYVEGGTKSSDMPVTQNAFQKTMNGVGDIFVARIAPDGKSLIYCTYFGGNGNETTETHGLYVDKKGQAYVAFATSSTDNVVTADVIKPYNDGTFNDIGLIKLSSDGSELLASTYIGGSNGDHSEGIFVDSLENVYVGGGSSSLDFPITSNAYLKSAIGKSDGVIIKLNPRFTEVLYASYFGGTNNESIRAFGGNDSGLIGFSGQTSSDDIVVSDNSIQKSRASKDNTEDSFLGILNIEEISSVSLIKNEIDVFPNPTNSNFNLNFEIVKSSEVKIELFTSNGKFVKLLYDNYLQNGKHSLNWDISDLTSSNYQIIITTENSKKYQQIILSK